MALDNYTRNQKIFVATLIIVLASTFTVSGAMMIFFDSTAHTLPSEYLKVDGEGLRYAEGIRMKRALGIAAQLDYGALRDTKLKETLYARVPTLSTREIDGYTMWGNAEFPRVISLLDLWPSWQDQRLLCHMELLARARKAGVEQPSNVQVGTVLTALMNAGAGEADKFETRDVEKQFQRRFGEDLKNLLPMFRECMMVRDYVDSLLSAERATLAEIARIDAGGDEEFKAELMRLSIDFFMARALKEVQREAFAWRASQLAGGPGVATHGFATDAFEEAYDRNRNTQTQAEAKFVFDVILAFPADMPDDKVRIDEERLGLTYEAMREEMFKATEDDKKNIEKRLNDAVNKYMREHPDETKAWKEDKEVKEWKDKQRPEFEKYRSLDEVRGDLQSVRRSENSVEAAQRSLASLKREFDEIQRRRERELNAGLDVLRKQQAVYDGVKGYLDMLHQGFTGMEAQVWGKLTPLASRITANPSNDDLKRFADDLARVMQQLDNEQLGRMQSMAGGAGNDLERQLSDRRAAKEEFDSKKEKRNETEQLMTDAEVKSKLAGFDKEIEAINERIRIRDQKLPLVEAFVTSARALLAGYELSARQVGTDGDTKLRAAALNSLVVDAAGRLSKFAKNQAELVVAQSEIDSWDDKARLTEADLQSQHNSMSKEAADTRSLNIDAMAGEYGLRVTGTSGAEFTWEQVVNNESLRYLDHVDGAKAFLEDANNYAGSVSNIMRLPGKGYLMLRIKQKSPKYPQGRLDDANRVFKLAAMKRARELTIDALKEVRRDVVDHGWDAALKRAQDKYGTHLAVVKTGWFTEKMDVPNVYSEGDSDLLTFGAAPSAGSPDQPLMSRLKEIPVHDGVTEIIPEKRTDDPLKRPDTELWAYMLARLTDRRLVPHRMDENSLKETGYSPGELWRNAHLASSELVRGLVTPAVILEGKKIILYKTDADKNDNEPADGASR